MTPLELMRKLRRDAAFDPAALARGKEALMAAIREEVEPRRRPQAKLPAQHGAGQVGVDEHGPSRPPRKRPRQREDEGRPSLGTMAAREEEHLQVLAIAGLDECVGQA